MHAVAGAVQRTIIRLNLIPPGSRVLVALSGGSDSVALVHLLRDIASSSRRFEVVALAHLHHGLRGQAADEDERFCRALGESLGLPTDVERVDVGALAASEGRSLEDAGRQARYAFLRRAAQGAGADRIAVGHTLDDQAETFLMRLVRGAGSRGLAGIHPRVGTVVRPLIEQRRAGLRAYLADRHISWREDETNADLTIPRNRIRHELIPYLERHLSPSIVATLSRDAALARADSERLDEEATAEGERLVRGGPGGRVELEVGPLLLQPEALGSRLIQGVLRQVSGHRFIGYDHVMVVDHLARSGEEGGRLDLPGVTVVRAGGRLRFLPAPRSAEARGRAQGSANRSRTNSFRIPLSIPGEALVPPEGGALTAEPAPWPAAGLRLLNGKLDLPPEVAVVDAGSLPRSLAVRFRRPGDRFRPLGLSGCKKLHDVFVDRKVGRTERDTIPLVVDGGTDRIIWVAGHVIAEEFRVTERTEAVVILKLEHWRDRA